MGDTDVQAELEAMESSFFINRTFSVKEEAMAVDEGPKKSITKNIVKLPQLKCEKSANIKAKSDSVTLSVTHITDQEQELLNVLMTVAHTSKEKYCVLDARDKLIRLRHKSMRDLTKTGRTIGTCTDMCPEKERFHREMEHQVAVYEQIDGCKDRMNHAVAVKQYSRSSADQEAPLAHELRPVEVLKMTMGYLLHQIMDLSETPDVNLAEWYHFVWDRTRSIRKDITQQELFCLDTVTLVEQCSRFHIHCSARLTAEEDSVFSEKINTENLTKCLQTLKYMYHDLSLSDSQVTCANEPEFRAYIVLLNLNDANFMWDIQRLSYRIQQSREIKFAIEVYSALDKNNYVKFFKLVRSTTYLNACILMRYFNQIRFKALNIILKSYSPRPPYRTFPIAKLTDLLAFEDEQNTMAFIQYYGLQLTRENTHILLDRSIFHPPDAPFSLERAIKLVESKRTTSVAKVICGCSLPEKTFLHHIPYNSFDENGRLKLLEVSKEWQPKYLEYLQKFPSNTQEQQSSSVQLFVEDMDVELNSYHEESCEVEKPSAEFRFCISPLISSSVSREQLNLNVPCFKFTAPPDLMTSDSQDVSESQVNVQENTAGQDNKSILTSSVQPFWINTVKPATSIFGSNQNIFGNTVQYLQPTVVLETDVFNTNANIVDNTSAKNIQESLSFSFLAGEMLHMHVEDTKPQSILAPTVKPDISLTDISLSSDSTVNLDESDSDKEEWMLEELLLKPKHESVISLSSDSTVNQDESDSDEEEWMLEEPLLKEKDESDISLSSDSTVNQDESDSDEEERMLEEPLLKEKDESDISLSSDSTVNQDESDSDEEERMLEEPLLKEKDESDISLPSDSSGNQDKADSDEEEWMLLEIARAPEERRKLEQRIMEEQLEQQKLECERKLKSEVDNLLQEMVFQVVEKIRMKRLNELESNVATRTLAEYFNKWRTVTRIARKKRKCDFDDSPIWIPNKCIKTLANELHTESQELTLKDMKRYRSGTAQQQLPVRKPVQLNSIDMCQTVWRILFEKLCGSARLLRLNVYWKIGISLPNIVEDKCSSWYRKQMTSAFQLNTNLSSVRQFAMNNGGCFTYNVKHVTDLENGLNGLMFFVNVISDVTYTRLDRVIDINQPAPLVVILGTDSNKPEDIVELQLKLKDLRNQGAIADYTLIYSNKNLLQKAIIDGLKWLATNVKEPLDLEMDAMVTYLRNGVGEDLWHRIRSAANINHQFGMLLTDPNITIHLHNEAVRRLINIILDPEISNQQNFPSEFKNFIENQQIILPCTYEYFPDNWKDKSHVQSMITNMETLILPKYNYSWPDQEFVEFHNSLKHYCARLFGENDSKVFLKVINVVYQRNDYEDIQNVSWPDIIQVIVLEKLKRMSFLDESKEVATVVYKKTDLKQYFNVPWWYNLELISNRITKVQMEEFSESDKIDTETDINTDIDKILGDIPSLYLDDNEEVLAAKDQMNELNSAIKDLEESMEIFKQRSYHNNPFII